VSYWAYRGSARAIQGLLVVNGRTIAPRAKTQSGGVLIVEAGISRLDGAQQPGSYREAALAIQCSPRLVAGGAIVPKLESARLAARTALCVRDRGRILDAYLTEDGGRTTLRELASFLLEEGCEAALNLDGGPSTAAVFRDGQRELRVGTGAALPYGLAFTARE
jgi:hypothetical protein